MQALQLTVSPAPHIHGGCSVQKCMMHVLLSLIPSVFCAVLYFGLRAAELIFISAASCVIFEFAWQKLRHDPISITDGSAAVTGVLLALSMPVTVPWWMPMIGSFFSIVIVKALFGGLGCNFVNPALAGRTFLLVSWPALMMHFVSPFAGNSIATGDACSSATPLMLLKNAETIKELPSFLNMCLGNISGSMGETSVIAVLLGGLYLWRRHIISLYIPLSFVGTVAVLSLLCGHPTVRDSAWVGYQILGGGLLFGAFFMATDYVTSPISPLGQFLMGIGCGAVTFLIRCYGGYPEGVSYGILLMNTVTPLIDKFCRPQPFGYQGGR